MHYAYDEEDVQAKDAAAHSEEVAATEDGGGRRHIILDKQAGSAIYQPSLAAGELQQ